MATANVETVNITTSLSEKVDEKDQESEEELDKSIPTEINADQKREERMKRLRELHMRRNESRKLNRQEVIEEDKRKKLPANFEARRRKAEWELQEEEARKKAEEEGEDYEQLKLLQTGADELERLERKRKKKNPDAGFSDYNQAHQRHYEKQVKQMKPDLEAYEKQKQEMGDEFFPTANSLGYGGLGEVSAEGVERMVSDVYKQISKHAKFSRRREFQNNEDIDYINERNRKFNKKASRFYDKYTAEIKQNLERGTAL